MTDALFSISKVVAALALGAAVFVTGLVYARHESASYYAQQRAVYEAQIEEARYTIGRLRVALDEMEKRIEEKKHEVAEAHDGVATRRAEVARVRKFQPKGLSPESIVERFERQEIR